MNSTTNSNNQLINPLSTNSTAHTDNTNKQRVIDYFIIAGLPTKLTASKQQQQQQQQQQQSEPNVHGEEATNLSNVDQIDPDEYEREYREHQRLLYPNLELESYKLPQNLDALDPIVEIGIVNKTLNEIVPIGFECIWLTPANHSANLIHDTFIKSNEMFICYRRGKDKPPITDIGIYYEGAKERVMDGCVVIRQTVGGNHANLNNSTVFTTERIYLTYRPGNEMACNSLAVIDICVIAKNKNEVAPHTFNEIERSLNRNIIGSSAIHICYKKAYIPAPQIKYLPNVLFRYPQQDHVDLPFPGEVATFGLPMGAVIESWPTSLANRVNKPVFSTFVLNVNSDDGVITEKVYGACITFYETFDRTKLTKQQKMLLNASSKDEDIELLDTRILHSNKCLIVLSRYPLFTTFKEFLYFMFTKYSNLSSKSSSCLFQEFKDNQFRNDTNATETDIIKRFVKIEAFLSHLIYDVPFPTQLKPRVLINLTEDNCISINLPYENILPQSGASFIDFLTNLGVENSINVFLFVLLQRNVMFHSLRRAVLTGVVEAISCIIFPFIWRYSYLPMCPLNLCQLIEAPGSFILGMDTRFFDIFDPPPNVLCVDLDTNTLSWTADRKLINLKILPKKALNNLHKRLDELLKEIVDFNEKSLKLSLSNRVNNDLEAKIKRQEKMFNLSIREAFLKFMASILFNYKSYLRTNTRKPDMKALDRNLVKFFDTDGFLRSKEPSCQYFFKELVKTQLFYDCIMNLSFASELDQTLADAFLFFSEICSKLNAQSIKNSSGQQMIKDEDLSLIDLNNFSSNNQTIVVLPPVFDDKQLIIDLTSMDETNSTLADQFFIYDLKSTHFPRLRAELYSDNISSTNDLMNENDSNDNNHNKTTDSSSTNNQVLADTQSLSSFNTQINSGNANAVRKLKTIANTPIGVRTKAEKLQAQKQLEAKLNFKTVTTSSSQHVIMKQNEKNRHTAAKVHAFYYLSNTYSLWFIYLPEYLKQCQENAKYGLNYAYQVLIQMQKHNLTQPDEICFRIMMQLCLIYKFPTLAVRTLLHMKKYKIELTPITYSYYNKAITEYWPSFEKDRWGKIRLIWLIVSKFKQNLLIKKERERREERERRKKRRSSKSLKRQQPKENSNKKASALKTNTSLIKNSNLANNSKHNTTLDDGMKQVVEKVDQTKLSYSSDKADGQSNNKSSSSLLSNETGSTFNKLKLEIKNSLSNMKFSSKMTPNEYSDDLLVENVGILKLSDLMRKKNQKKKNVVSSSSSKLSLDKKMSISEILDLSKLRSVVKSITFPIPPKANNQKNNKASITVLTPITQNDPLGAFDSANRTADPTTPIASQNDKVRKRLFELVDYVPFSNNIETKTIKTSDKAAGKSSDFLYNGNGNDLKKTLMANNQQQQQQHDIYSKTNAIQTDDNENDEEDECDEDEEQDDEDEDEYEYEYQYDDENDEDEEDSYDEDEDEDEEDSDEEGSERFKRGNGNRLFDSFSLNTSNKVSQTNAISNNAENNSISSSSNLKRPNNHANTNSSNSSLNENMKRQGNHSANDHSSTNTFTSPISTPSFLGVNKVISFMKKMENTLEQSNTKDKLKNVSRFIQDRTLEIKDVILSNTNQQDITNKLKSISNYNLSNTPQYLNGFVKSNTTMNEFGSATKQHNGHSHLNHLNKHMTPSESVSSQTSLENNQNSAYHFNINEFEPVPNDDTFKPLSMKWWGLDPSIEDNTVNCKTNESLANSIIKIIRNEDALIDLQISSCNYCENCKSLLYDEEIMSGWTLNDSDLNIKCAHCTSPLVPNLFIKIQDLDNIRRYIWSNQDDINNEDTTVPSTPVTPMHPFVSLDEHKLVEQPRSPRNNRISQIKLNQNEFTVQYLSPLVVRKELENIITHSKQEMNNDDDEPCLIDLKFIEEHSVVFWNLIWYFNRIGVDSGQLSTILLNSRIIQLRKHSPKVLFFPNEYSSNDESENDDDDIENNLFLFKNFVPNRSVAKPNSQHPHVNIKCMWDNLRLQDRITSHEVPLYLSYLISNHSFIQEQMRHRIVSILSLNELKSIRKSGTNPRSLVNLFEQITRNIKESDVMVPIRSLLRERLRSKANYSSIYREILFLVLVTLERELIDIDAFDTEYREAYKSLLKSDTQELIKSSDKPPNNIGVWCRRLFSPLLL